MAYRAAIAAASVGVVSPKRMPLRMIRGMIRARKAARKERMNFFGVNSICRWGKLRRLAWTKTTPIWARPMRTPGMMAPANMAATEVLVMAPYTTITMLGGMMGPMIDEPATTAAAYFLVYPSFSMLGMNIVPSAETSATAAPVIPAKIMLATMLT